jgi:membrane protein YqaA with SNARE-associated domain
MPGLFCVSAIDASVVPLPIPGTTDLLLLWLVSHNGDPWLLAVCAIAGSILGGYTTWHIGRKGGEAALHRYVPAWLLDPVCRWVKRHPILAVCIPSALPPPMPLSPFLLASGALGVPLARFLVAFSAARAVRYSLVAWLGATYGRHMVRMWSNTLEAWSTPLLWAFGGLLAIGIGLAIYKLRRTRTAGVAGHPGFEGAAD